MVNLLEVLQNGIEQNIICSKCETEFLLGSTDSRSLQDYSRLDIGFTSIGVQVWCRRHDANVVHIDFAGQKPTADFRCIE
jgi:hypothetical protein|tara:strand:- start:1185 stop:1424 length:240 start_codon:yes stop_codon:yes gene_type:complete